MPLRWILLNRPKNDTTASIRHRSPSMAPSWQPCTSKKAVVELLMTKEAEIIKDVPSRSGCFSQNVVHLVFCCPKVTHCKDQLTVTLEKGSVYTKPVGHLKSCISRGDEKHLLQVYKNGLSGICSVLQLHHRVRVYWRYPLCLALLLDSPCCLVAESI